MNKEQNLRRFWKQQICADCGLKQCPKPTFGVTTFNHGKCDRCGEIKSVTAERHYPVT